MWSPTPSTASASVEINEAGDAWRIVLGPGRWRTPDIRVPQPLHEPQRPQGGHERAPNRVIYHCHATNVIALTYILPLTDRDFSRRFVAECHRVPGGIPRSVGVCPWMVPRRRRHRHGHQRKDENLSGGRLGPARGCSPPAPTSTPPSAWPTPLRKSAEIYVKVLSMGGGLIRQTIEDDDLRAIARDFGVQLNEAFLN